jgi:drug/metabolite transporter (DMT)-like permease
VTPPPLTDPLPADPEAVALDAGTPAGAASTAPRPPAPWLGYGLAAGGAALFSTKSVIIKLAYAEGVNAETLLALRMVLSLPVFLVVGAVALRTRARGGNAAPDRRLVFRACWVGALGYWVASYTDFLGLAYISAHFERLILFTYPGFVVLFGAAFFGQRVRAHTLAALGLSYAGLVVIFASDLGPGGKGTAVGAGLVSSAAVAYAAYQLLAKDAIARLGPPLFTCVAMTAAAAAALAQFALTQPPGTLLVRRSVLGYGLLLAVGATVLPSFMLNAALHRISAQANAIIGTLSPVATIVLAVAVLGEVLGPADVVGTLLVIAGVGWFTLADRRR